MLITFTCYRLLLVGLIDRKVKVANLLKAGGWGSLNHTEEFFVTG